MSDWPCLRQFGSAFGRNKTKIAFGIRFEFKDLFLLIQGTGEETESFTWRSPINTGLGIYISAIGIYLADIPLPYVLSEFIYMVGTMSLAMMLSGSFLPGMSWRGCSMCAWRHRRSENARASHCRRDHANRCDCRRIERRKAARITVSAGRSKAVGGEMQRGSIRLD